MNHKLAAVMPPLTFCMIPNYKRPLDLLEMQDFSKYCPGREDDVVGCIEDMR